MYLAQVYFSLMLCAEWRLGEVLAQSGYSKPRADGRSTSSWTCMITKTGQKQYGELCIGPQHFHVETLHISLTNVSLTQRDHMIIPNIREREWFQFHHSSARREEWKYLWRVLINTTISHLLSQILIPESGDFIPPHCHRKRSFLKFFFSFLSLFFPLILNKMMVLKWVKSERK